MDSADIVFVVWAVFSLTSWCVLAIRKRDNEVKEDKTSVFELLSTPGSAFLLFPVMHMLTSNGYLLFISVWLYLVALMLTVIIYYPIYNTVNNSKDLINRIVCCIFLVLQLVYYILYCVESINNPPPIDTELFIMFILISYFIPAFITTISQIVHLFFRHRFFIVKVDNPKFLKAVIYSFTLNLIASLFTVYGFINFSTSISIFINDITGIIVYDALRICSYVVTYALLIINLCTQFVTYKSKATETRELSDDIFRDNLAYLQYSGYYVGFNYFSYIFNCTLIYAICVCICFLYTMEGMLEFVLLYGLVLSFLIPYISLFLVRKFYQMIYGYHLYGRDYKPFKSTQGLSVVNNDVKSFWLYFTFFISILFGIYSFINRGIFVPLLRLMFASTYPRPNSRGVLDVGYRLSEEDKFSAEMI